MALQLVIGPAGYPSSYAPITAVNVASTEDLSSFFRVQYQVGKVMILIHTQVAKKGKHHGDSRDDFEDGNCDSWNHATFWEIHMALFFVCIPPLGPL